MSNQKSETPQVHGHDVMNMMIESGKTYTRQTLREDIHAQFGTEARFYTCAAENMTADELIDFLAMRGKFIDNSDGFQTDPTKVCNH